MQIYFNNLVRLRRNNVITKYILLWQITVTIFTLYIINRSMTWQFNQHKTLDLTFVIHVEHNTFACMSNNSQIFYLYLLFSLSFSSTACTFILEIIILQRKIIITIFIVIKQFTTWQIIVNIFHICHSCRT